MSVAAAATLALAYVAVTGMVDGENARLISDLALTALPFIAAGACTIAASRHQGRARLAWGLIAAGLISWGAGELLWTLLEVVWHQDTFPSVADVGYLAGFPLAAAGIVLFPRVREDRRSPLRSLMDGALVSTSVFLVGWVTVLHPLLASSSGSTVEQAISLAYPLSDIAIVSVVVFVSGDPMRDRQMPLMLVGFGFVGMAIADSSYAYLTLTDSYRSGHPMDAAWVASYVLLGMAAFAPSARDRWSSVHAKVARVRSSLPYVVAGLAFVLVQVAAKGGIGAVGGPVIYWSPVVLAILVVSRHFVLALESKAGTITHLHALDELKNSFMQAASHELRTPLTVIKGVAETLEDSDDLTDEIKRTLYASLRRNSDRLDSLLQSLLDLGRLERGIIVPQRAPTDVGALIERVISGVNAPMHIITASSADVTADVDPAQLERIVENLVVNAVRHTPPGSSVDVSAEHRAGGLLLTVDDDGPGIPADRRDDVFQPFVRVNEPGRETPGTGIGLRIVDQFAKLHGGRAWVEERPGGGARFLVFLADPHEDQVPAGVVVADADRVA
jgi:signal transduction histidine kinase